tara:strand:- start:9646 stop:10692 length:1047 start_codon:yes stop_codon:yes gene_type:complete
MANVNIRTPRFYCDSINYRLSRGVAINDQYDVIAEDSGADIVGIKSGGGVESDLFDMRPTNTVTFNTKASADTREDHVIITLDLMGTNTNVCNFVAILNHNGLSSNAKFRIKTTDTEPEIQSANMNSANAMNNPVSVLNGNVAGSSPFTITPVRDGSTIITFDETNDRFIGIQIEAPTGGFSSSNDFTAGCILAGEFFDMPSAPDLQVKRSIAFDKVTVQESVGGQRYSNMSNFGKTTSEQNVFPFLTTTSPQQVFGGRMSYEMSFSYLSSADIMPNDYSTHNATDDSTIEDVWNKVNGSHIPFIFTTDGSSTSESDYLFARFAQDSLEMNQVAPDVFNMSLTIEEEF